MLAAETLRVLAGPGVGVGVRYTAELTSAIRLPELDALPPDTPAPRREQFALGRLAARDALADLDAPVEPIAIGAAREPVWPAGCVGSIAHTRRVAVSVVGWGRSFVGVGIDVESARREIPEATARRICTPDEASWVAASADPAMAIKRIFCAKEATYKALAPVAGFFGFQDVGFAEGEGDLLEGVVLLRDRPLMPARVTARTLVAAGFLLACVRVPQPGA